MMTQLLLLTNTSTASDKRIKKRKSRFLLVSLLAATYGQACFYCNKDFSLDLPYTFEHVIPASRKGTLSLANIVLSCPQCNNKRDNFAFLDYVERFSLTLSSEDAHALDEKVGIFMSLQGEDCSTLGIDAGLRSRINMACTTLLGETASIDSDYKLVA